MSSFVRVTKIFFNKMKKINSHTSFLLVFWGFFFLFLFNFERENGRQIICWQSICLTVIFVFTFSTIYWTLFNQTSCFYGDIL